MGGNKFREIRRPGGLETQGLVQARVLESQHKSMQRLAGEIRCHCKRIGLGVRPAPGRGAGAAILGIADQGMAQMGEMDADLVGAPGFQAAFYQRGEGPFNRPEFFQHLIAPWAKVTKRQIL